MFNPFRPIMAAVQAVADALMEQAAIVRAGSGRMRSYYGLDEPAAANSLPGDSEPEQETPRSRRASRAGS